MRQKRLLWLIIVLTAVSLYIDLPSKFWLSKWEINLPPLDFTFAGYRIRPNLQIRKGIDLAGGTHLVFQADMKDIQEADRDSALGSVAENIQRRVNLFGLNETLVQTSKLADNYRLVVEIPGVENIGQAVDLIGQTARLDFRELKKEATQASTLADFLPTGLTGKDLAKSVVQFDQNTGKPVVGLKFSDEGAKKFSEITGRNVNRPVGIFLDDLPVTIPMVKEQIKDGQAVITGEYTADQAKQLSTQLNAGALPAPIKIIEQRNIGAILGTESVQKSVRAGMIGLLMVILFMALYYGRLGILADVGLIIYGLLTLTIYKIFAITLTLPGIAGFLLSVGMAVDSNILIFERMKEEERMGKPRLMAMELGFGRAWDSIKDANICTLITCFILFNPFGWSFLNTSGMIRGFALTLVIGVVLSLFTGIVVTRTILRSFAKKGAK
jgi:preprotein translocase subunit SecD